jgi:hypothetical protein
MAVVRDHESEPVDAHDLGVAFAEVVREDQAAERLWVTEHRGLVRLWLLTKPLDGAGERRLHGLEDHLYDRFPEARFHLVLLNPRFFDHPDLQDLVPSDAEEIALGAA